MKRKERFDLLHNYALATIHLYGAITQDEFVEIFNQQNNQKTSVDELFPILLRHIAVGAPYCFWDEYIVCDGFEDNDFEDVNDLIRECGDKPRYIPEKKELLRYSDWDYYENTLQTDRLKQFLSAKRLKGTASIDEIVAELQYSCTIEAGTQQIFDTLDEYGVSIKDSEMNTIIDILMGMKNNTRLWANKGHTPNEIAALYGFPSLQPKHKVGGQRKLAAMSLALAEAGRNINGAAAADHAEKPPMLSYIGGFFVSLSNYGSPSFCSNLLHACDVSSAGKRSTSSQWNNFLRSIN